MSLLSSLQVSKFRFIGVRGGGGGVGGMGVGGACDCNNSLKILVCTAGILTLDMSDIHMVESSPDGKSKDGCHLT